MKLKHFSSVFFLFSLVLLWSCRDRDEAIEPAIVQPGSSLYYYNSGLDTSDLEVKLDFYNQGLRAIKGTKDTVLPSLLEGKVYALITLGKADEARYWADSLLKAAKKFEDTYYIAKGHYWLYKLHKEKKDLPAAFENLFRSKQLYLQMGDSSKAGWRSMDMAILKYDSGDYAGTQESAIEALKLLDREKYPYLVSAVYNIIGLSYLDRGFSDEAQKEFKNALEYSINEKDSLSFLHNYALALNSQEKYDESLEIFRKLIKSDAPSHQSKSRFLDNYANTLWKQDTTREMDSLFFTALQRRKETEDYTGLEGSYLSLSNYYSGTNEFKARKYARLLLENTEKTANKAIELIALKRLIALTPPQEAESYMDRYIFLDDSLSKAELKAKHVFAKVEFDEKQKQKQITELRETAANQALINERLKWRNAFITLSFLFSALLALVLFYFFRQKSRKKHFREVYQTESRIARRIHDELANDLYGVMNRLSSTVPSKTVDQLEEIYRRTRDISRENAEIDTSETFPSFLTAMLSDNTGKAKLIIKGESKLNWEKLSEEKKIVLYRVLQELMINMRKHSDARLVAIIFEQKQNMLEIKYSDTGRGAAPEKLFSGSGLKNVKNRMASIGGKVSFDTVAGEGFKATISVPFHNQFSTVF